MGCSSPIMTEPGGGPTPLWEYVCAMCGMGHDPSHTDYCSACGSPVLAARTARPTGELAADHGIWRYAGWLPVDPDLAGLSLGETMTPLVPAPALAEAAGVGQVWLKLDHLCPTGSFKDRAAAAAVAHAVAHHASAVVCASSGNAAASAAAYAARAGLPAVVVVPVDVPPNKLASCRAYGAIPVAVPGDYSHSFNLARQLCHEFGLTNLATTYVNPHGTVALRSVAFDIADQVGADVDWMHVPTGSGPLVHGVAAGFRDLIDLGRATVMPRIVAVQPEGCAPIVRAFDRDADLVEPWENVTTRVSGINDPLHGYQGDGTITLRELRASRGCAIASSDTEILRAADQLAGTFGVFAEPAAAASVAGLQILAERGVYSRDDVVVCLITGNGLKTASAQTSPVRVADSLSDAADVLASAGLELNPHG